MMTKLKRRLQTFFNINPDEMHVVALSFVYFFSLLASYYVLRPIRDEMSMQLGSAKLQENFFSVFLIMLILVPVFGWITKRFSRTVALPRIYSFFTINLLFFFFIFEADGLQNPLVAKSFFVWVSVYNLFVVSVFWSYMADIFTTEQSSRLNGLISAGGTLGALTGPLITSLMVESIGVKNLVLVSAGFLVVAIACIQRLRHETGTRVASQIRAIEKEPGFSGSILSGIADLFRFPYLLGICVFLLIYSVLSTFLYGMSTDLIPQFFSNSLQRTKLLAQIDLAVNLVALLCQFFIFNKLLSKFGRRAGLLTLPILSVLGFALFGLTQNLWIMLVFAILRRAGEYSITKPTRETLFNVLPAEQKYRAKNVIDTLVHRTGDVSSVSLFSVLQKAGTTIQGFSFLAFFLSLGWIMNAIWLGRRADKLLAEARAQSNDPKVHQ